MTALDRFKAAIGDMARPFSIYASAGAASVATVMIGYGTMRALILGHVDGWGVAAVGAAIWGGVAALYWGKAFETQAKSKHEAAVKIEEVKATAPQPTPLPPGTVVATPPAEVTVSAPAPETATVPPWDRK